MQKSVSRSPALSGAQGTIEYLVIIAIVVVISLVVVGLLIGMTGSGKGVSDASSKIGNKVGSGGLSISGAVNDSNGDGIFSLNNVSGETITLTKIAAGGVENSYSQTVPAGGSVALSVNALDLKCPCLTGQTKASCDYAISYTSGNGLPKTITVTVQTDCVDDSKAPSPIIPPIITISNNDCWSDTANPHPICTLTDLNRMRTHLDWNYSLEADINAAATKTWADVNGFMPVGESGTKYSGTFNGNNHYVASLYIYRPATSYVGLFGYADGNSKMQNAGLRDANITGSVYVGGLVGYSAGSVSGSYSTGSVTGAGMYVGGLIGYGGGSSSVVNSYSTVNASSTGFNVGGLIGYIIHGSVSNCYATGRVNGPTAVGGLIGQLDSNSSLMNSYATGDVNGAGSVGGLVGYSYRGDSVVSSYSSGSVTGSSNYVGGLVGQLSNGSVSNSYATGKVTGLGNSVGGLVGTASGVAGSTGTVFGCYAIGDVNGVGNYVGGLVGQTVSTVKNSFSEGNVDGNSYVGGLVGYATSINSKDVNNNYSISRVNGLYAPMMGFLGQKTSSDVNFVFNAYWNPALATKATCYQYTTGPVDLNTNCTIVTSTASDFYGATGIPFVNLGFDGNWVSQSGGYPKLIWQTN